MFRLTLIVSSLAFTFSLARADAPAKPETFNSSQMAGSAPKLTREDPPFSSAPNLYSGISGPGKKVSKEGIGGWRSGRDGIRYKGPDPKPGWHLDWDEKKTSS